MVKRRCILYIHKVPNACVRMHIPEPDDFLRTYLRTILVFAVCRRTFGVPKSKCVSECMCARKRERERESEKLKKCIRYGCIRYAQVLKL